MSLVPLKPIETVHLIREVDEALIPLLRGLGPEDWRKVAVGDWTVHDVAAHLLDGAVRRLSLDRDGHQPPPPEGDLSDYRELVGFLNDLNATWVKAAERLSPGVMTDLLEYVCPQMADYFDSLDPGAEASFPVSWAGETSSKVWMDVAREFTERWHHQQQIREAVGAPGLDQERYVRPLVETFIRALPRSYSSVEAANGATVGIRISDLDDLGWGLQRLSDSWGLGLLANDLELAATVEVSADTTWRLFTKALTGPEARNLARISGDQKLVDPFFSTLGVMA